MGFGSAILRPKVVLGLVAVGLIQLAIAVTVFISSRTEAAQLAELPCCHVMKRYFSIKNWRQITVGRKIVRK